MTTNNQNSVPQIHYTKDHLGNIRNVIAKKDGVVQEVQHTAYYPFGGIIADLSSGRGVQNRFYNGKELDYANNLYWLDYGARQYDPTRGQFTTPDPLAEFVFSQLPYAYANYNPIYYIELWGLEGVPINNVDWSNFNIEEDCIELESVSCIASAQKGNTSNEREINDFFTSDISIVGGVCGVVGNTADIAGNNMRKVPADILSPIVWKAKKTLKKKCNIDIKYKTAELYRGVIPTSLKNVGKYAGVLGTVTTGLNILNNAYTSNKITVGDASDFAVALVSFSCPAFGLVYTIADILLDTTIDKGVSDLINDASEFVVGNNGISW